MSAGTLVGILQNGGRKGNSDDSGRTGYFRRLTEEKTRFDKI
jgi:hypothetical protein